MGSGGDGDHCSFILVKVLLLYHGGKSLEAEAHVAQQRGPKPPPGETRGASGCGQPHH